MDVREQVNEMYWSIVNTQKLISEVVDGIKKSKSESEFDEEVVDSEFVDEDEEVVDSELFNNASPLDKIWLMQYEKMRQRKRPMCESEKALEACIRELSTKNISES